MNLDGFDEKFTVPEKELSDKDAWSNINNWFAKASRSARPPDGPAWGLRCLFSTVGTCNESGCTSCWIFLQVKHCTLFTYLSYLL